MAKQNGNGKVDHEPGLVEQALARSKARTAKVPGGHLIDLELESFVAFHPGGDPADLVTVIEERTISALSLLENFYQSVIDPAVRDLRFLKVQTPDEKHPKPTPQNQIDTHLSALIAAGWGSRLADDLGFLKGSYCLGKPRTHDLCSHLKDGERLVLIEPGSVRVQAEDGSERVIDRIQLVLDHREVHTVKLAVYHEKVIEPLRKAIDQKVRDNAERERAESNSGIVYDHRE